ncbi:MAG: EF-hand domain-containing protein [Pseudomonadota bacterium]
MDKRLMVTSVFILAMLSGAAFAVDENLAASDFDRIDTNGDGTITRAEWETHVQERQRMRGSATDRDRDRVRGGESVEEKSPPERLKHDRMERQSSQHGENPTGAPIQDR